MDDLFPVFKYYLAGNNGELSPTDELWRAHLSGDNNNLPVQDFVFTIGDYLLSAREFLERNKFQAVRDGLQNFLDQNVGMGEISEILISLDKHGPFYHPIKVTIVLKTFEHVFFVLNGAVSDMGLAIIETEYRNLKSLNAFSSNSYVPVAFDVGFVTSAKGKIGFLLGQWFDGFEEFHVVAANDKNRIGLLKNDGSFSLIPESEAFEIFRQASEILTFYYDINSFKQIFPWHHAAGDFIVKINNHGIEVKLITVRGYERLVDNDSDNLMFDLLLFFLNLSLRMRIDRDRGTKEYVFLDEFVMKACVDGFVKGLKNNIKRSGKTGNIDPEFYNIFIEFIKEFDFETILNIFIIVAGSCSSDVPERSIVEQNLKAHAKAMHRAIKKI